MAPVSSAKDPKPHLSKQFTELAGTPILIHTLRRFAAVDEVSEIWIALRENEIEGFRERLQKETDAVERKKIELVVGGEHRQQSVQHALNAITAGGDDIVLVHDAVRPLVTSEVIHEVIVAARKYGAAIAGLPAVDTVKQVDRTAEGFTGTDEASLAERAGHDVAVVMGSPKNIKITNPGDMELAEFYLKY